jgi:hypothetical protein
LLCSTCVVHSSSPSPLLPSSPLQFEAYFGYIPGDLLAAGTVQNNKDFGMRYVDTKNKVRKDPGGGGGGQQAPWMHASP